MPTVLVTGANRGLGLEFCKQYAEAGWRVLAGCRNPDSAKELKALSITHPDISVHVMDMADFAGIERLAFELSEESIDVLLLNAGIYTDDGRNGFGSLDFQKWMESFTVNTLAPVKLAEVFLPHVKRSGKKTIAAVSSLMGSMGDNSSGGSIMYRSSKAALNAAMKSLSINLAGLGINVLILHPGWVKTDMGGENAPTLPIESIAGMRHVIDTATSAYSGHFIDYKGKEAPW